MSRLGGTAPSRPGIIRSNDGGDAIKILAVHALAGKPSGLLSRQWRRQAIGVRHGDRFEEAKRELIAITNDGRENIARRLRDNS